MPDTSHLQRAQAATSTRIGGDIQRILETARKINQARDRVTSHTAALGYVPDTPGLGNSEAGGKVQPISETLQSALNDMDRAVDGLHTALALLDA